jgi:predicted Zn-ribbon and HTH transcriptional regulator
MSTPTECPKCKADLDGGPIPENIREHYRPPYRWSRVIGVELDHDRIEHWRCPDCGHEWNG